MVYVGSPESAEQPVLSPPIGTQLLGSVLLESGHDVALFDSRLQAGPALRAAIDDFDPGLVGLSFLSPNAPQGVELGQALRGDGRYVVMGGVHASIHHAELLAASAADCVVRGEGERVLPDICAAVAEGHRPPPSVPGRAVEDLDSLPDFADFDCYREVYAGSPRYRPVYLQLGRGCPMRCTFCELPNREIFAPPRRRFHSLERVLRELRTYRARWGVNFVTLVDSIATLNLPLVKDLVRELGRDHPDVGFMFNGHVNRFDRELAELVGTAQAGRSEGERITVWFGFESGSQRLLDFMRKDTTVEDGVAVALLCREHDVQVGANLLLGVPGENDRDYRLHHEFMARIDATYPNPNILNPLPGTRMYDYCAAAGLLRDATDYSIWTDQEIAAAGHGPVHGVDYDRVLATYRHFRQPPGAATAPAPRYESWAASGD
jgi:radical SAM superfamily enzyme YgiQ (UPF0313 family)